VNHAGNLILPILFGAHGVSKRHDPALLGELKREVGAVGVEMIDYIRVGARKERRNDVSAIKGRKSLKTRKMKGEGGHCEEVKKGGRLLIDLTSNKLPPSFSPDPYYWERKVEGKQSGETKWSRGSKRLKRVRFLCDMRIRGVKTEPRNQACQMFQE